MKKKPKLLVFLYDFKYPGLNKQGKVWEKKNIVKFYLLGDSLNSANWVHRDVSVWFASPF